MASGLLRAATSRERTHKVEILSTQESVKGSPEMFTGDVWYDVIVGAEKYPRMRVNIVRFAPGARTAWHSHAVGQTLYVTEGRGRAQSRGGQIIEIRPGDVVHTPSGEWHWHGAAPDHFMTHLAMWEEDGEGNSATWGAQVSDEEYAAASTDS
jgi:quercetin dioxygenase-like cupin family protein